MRTELETDLEHAKAAYKFAINALPNPYEISDAGLTLNQFLFTKESQIYSMKIELGWAFYCRYEACLEHFIKGRGIKFSKRYNISDWLRQNSIDIPPDYQIGLDHYRRIRNILHHENGKSAVVVETEAREIHLLPEHLDKFYDLFIWLARKIVEKSS